MIFTEINRADTDVLQPGETKADLKADQQKRPPPFERRQIIASELDGAEGLIE